MSNKSKENEKQINPEIQREQEEKRRAQMTYDEEEAYGMLLYPGAFLGGTSSATESTGLIQVIPPTPDMLDAYDEVYSYRQTEPIVGEDEDE